MAIGEGGSSGGRSLPEGAMIVAKGSRAASRSKHGTGRCHHLAEVLRDRSRPFTLEWIIALAATELTREARMLEGSSSAFDRTIGAAYSGGRLPLP